MFTGNNNSALKNRRVMPRLISESRNVIENLYVFLCVYKAIHLFIVCVETDKILMCSAEEDSKIVPYLNILFPAFYS